MGVIGCIQHSLANNFEMMRWPLLEPMQKYSTKIIVFEFAATSVTWDIGDGTSKLGCQIIGKDKDKDKDRGWIAGGDPKQAMAATTTLIVVYCGRSSDFIRAGKINVEAVWILSTQVQLAHLRAYEGCGWVCFLKILSGCILFLRWGAWV